MTSLQTAWCILTWCMLDVSPMCQTIYPSPFCIFLVINLCVVYSWAYLQIVPLSLWPGGLMVPVGLWRHLEIPVYCQLWRFSNTTNYLQCLTIDSPSALIKIYVHRGFGCREKSIGRPSPYPVPHNQYQPVDFVPGTNWKKKRFLICCNNF